MRHFGFDTDTVPAVFTNARIDNFYLPYELYHSPSTALTKWVSPSIK